jgi:hypothetical protein
MHPARFLTVCCLYSGALFLLTQILLYPSQLNIPVIWNSGAAVCILFVGLYRLYSEEAEKYPSEYGILTTGVAFLSLMVTIIFLAVLTESWK